MLVNSVAVISAEILSLFLLNDFDFTLTTEPPMPRDIRTTSNE